MFSLTAQRYVPLDETRVCSLDGTKVCPPLSRAIGLVAGHRHCRAIKEGVEVSCLFVYFIEETEKLDRQVTASGEKKRSY